MMLYSLVNNNFKRVDNPEEAEIIIINTCAFIETADEEAINTILEAAEYKTKGSCQKLVVTGCLSQKYKEDLLEAIPEIDIVLGTGNFMKITDFITKEEKRKGQVCAVSDPAFDYNAPSMRELLTPKYTAYLKIAEGCINCCSYCVIPRLRGPYRSRPVQSILKEAKSLVSQGVREITLIAQDTSLYGRDLPDPVDLSDLLALLAENSGAAWLRFLYFYPARINDKLLKTIKRYKNICRYMDIPLQHVNKDILRNMKRPGDYKSYYDMIAKIRDALPDITIRTTFIVGFPGETEREFAELMSFVERVEFDWAGIFAYSPQKNTPAYKLTPRVSKREVDRRISILTDLQLKITEKRNMRWINRVIPVLVEGKLEENSEFLTGRAENQAPEIDGMVYIKGTIAERSGHFVSVRITHAHEYDLMGEVCSEYCQYDNSGKN